MYKVTRTTDEVIVSGPEGFKKHLSADAIGLALRTDLEFPYEGIVRYAIVVSEMTDTEVVALALGISAYPQQ